MPITLNREMTQGPQGGQWRFSVRRTRRDSDVGEIIDQPLSHEVVAQIYDEVMGGIPGTGLELRNVLENNWDRLEPRLRNEIERRISPN